MKRKVAKKHEKIVKWNFELMLEAFAQFERLPEKKAVKGEGETYLMIINKAFRNMEVEKGFWISEILGEEEPFERMVA